jgi:Tfp pilus assembly protein PilO
VPHLDSAQWIGPLGGLLCVTFAAGCIAGWTFAMKLMNARIASMKAEITDLKSQVKELNAFMMRGMERQLGQVRESTYRVIVDGQEREEKG